MWIPKVKENKEMTKMKRVADVTIGLLKNTNSNEEKIRRIFYYVRDEIKFDFVDQFQSAEKVLNGKKGTCMNKALLLKEMAVCANIPARLHFMRVSKYALEDCMPKWLFKKWPEEFYHTLVEVKLNDEWVSMEPSFDQEYHEMLLYKRLNFGKYEERRRKHFSNDFNINGIDAPQQDCIIKGSKALYGEDLRILKESMKENPIWKRIFMKFFFKQASNYVNRVVRPKEIEVISPATEEGHNLTCEFDREAKLS